MATIHASQKKQSSPAVFIWMVLVLLLAVVIYFLVPRSRAAEQKVPKPMNTSHDLPPEVPLVEVRYI
jgi:hypothetical protein